MNIIQNNPYRVLGVYSNAPKREIVGAENKIKAHVKIGRAISFKTDFNSLLGEVERNDDSLSSSMSNLTLAKDKIRYALFWFINENAFDEVAFNHLASDNIDSAIEILRKKSTASSFVNLAVCFLIKRQWANALYCYSQLVEEDRFIDFISIVAGDEYKVSSKEFSYTIIESLEHYYPEVNWLFFTRTKNISLGTVPISLGDILLNSILVKELRNRYIEKTCDNISCKISEADKANRKLSSECLASAKILSRLSSDFKTLSSIVGKSDIRYTSLSDKVAETLNSLCIGYYNNSSDYRRARVIYAFVKDALSFACTDSILKTCQEGYNFITEKIEELPPETIEKECQEIDNHLSNYINNGNINSLLGLVTSCQNILTIIKNKVGENDKEYIKQSSTVVHFTINQIVDEVNEKQKAYNDAPEYLDTAELNAYINCLKWAKPIMEKLASFAKDAKCKERYEENNKTLTSLYNKNCVVRPTVRTTPTPRPVNRPISPQRPIYTPSSTNSSKKDDNYGCIIGIVIAVVIFIIVMIVSNSGSSSSNSSSYSHNNTQSSYSSSRNDSYNNNSKTNSSITRKPVKTQDEIWLEQYKGNSLKTGATPYRSVYGGNANSGNSSLKIKAPAICDVLVIVKRGGSVVKHAYIRANQTYTFTLWEGTYQPFFIYGNSWCPEKEAPNGQLGYFLEDVSISKDYPQEIGDYQELEYTLQAVRNGNFRAASSNANEAF